MSDVNVSPMVGKTLSDSEISEIVEQCNRVIESSWFRTSVRCSTLLRHLVEGAVNGRADQLRERMIAVKAFHRNPAYDNNTDPVVRTAAGEVRKRLAQYYNDPKNSGQIYIELPVGSYVPEFHFPLQAEPATHLVEPELTVPALEESFGQPEDAPAGSRESQPDPVPVPRAPYWARKWTLAVALVLFVAAVGGWLSVHSPRPVSGFDAFWAPVLSAQRQALISMGDVAVRHAEFVPNGERSRISNNWSLGKNGDLPTEVRLPAFGNAIAATRVAGLLGKNGKLFEVFSQSKITFDDLSKHPVIMIGSYDNDWTIRDTDTMRFQFEVDFKQDLRWISDREKPSEQIGALHNVSAVPQTFQDFAVVARSIDPTTGQPVVILAGVTSMGAIAAADFATDSSYLNDFARKAPPNWASKNVEFLIAANVVDGAVGRPRIVSYSIW